MNNRSELHRYYDALTVGICLVDRKKERILFANRGLLALYRCSGEEEFLSLTGGTFSGMTTREGLSLSRACGDRTDCFPLHFGFQTKDQHFREADAIVSLTEEEGVPCYCMQIVTMQMERGDEESDRLTGFPGSREFFHDAIRIARENAQGGTFSAWCPVCFNIADFRGFNRQNGMEEGDRVLSQTAKILRETFPEGYFGHANADTFYALLPRKNLRDRIDAACRSVNHVLGDRSSALKAGIVTFDEQVAQDVLLHSFDMAKIACDSIKSDRVQNAAVFRPQMQEQLELRQYILSHFQEALQQGYLRIYCQPIIRTATGKICSVEALSRWEDPEKGLISPGIYVPILEKARLVGQLDAYMIDHVAAALAERKKRGVELVPVSFNLSRLDFDLIQPLRSLEEACLKYQIPENCLVAEITETALEENREEMGRIIQGFHAAGFEIWLDDFGSVYSSLNSLHRCPFDLIKLDMGFFQNFDGKSRAILTNLVSMAKDLGMHTLAEGVETKEQVEFLRSIGCERIQGYYYSRPLSVAGLQELAGRNGLSLENRLQRSIFDAAGLVNLVSQTPTSLFFVDGEEISVLAANAAYLPELVPEGKTSLEHINQVLSGEDPALQGQFTSFAKRVYWDGVGDICCVLRGEYIRFHAEKIAGVEDYWVGRCTLLNMHYDQQIGQARKLDRDIRQLLPLFETISIADPQKDALLLLYSSLGELESLRKFEDLPACTERFTRQYIHPADRERHLAFCKKALQSSRIEESLFRILGRDGSYHWDVFSAMPIRREGRHCVLYCTRKEAFEREKGLAPLLPTFASSFQEDEKTPEEGADTAKEAALFESLLGNAGIPIYWKDREQRYLGMNDAFCRLLGIDSPSAALGKTAHELGFYLDAGSARREEDRALRGEGLPAVFMRTFLAGGRVRAARFLEVPFYRGKQVEGLLGIAPWEAEEQQEEPSGGTRVLDCAQILQAGLTLDDALRKTDRGYLAVLISLQHFDLFCETYGETLGVRAGELVQEAIAAETLPRDAVAGKLAADSYLLLAGEKSAEMIARAAGRVVNRLSQLQGIGGTPCRLEPVRAIGAGREADSFPALLQLLSLRTEPARARQRYQLEETWNLLGVHMKYLERIPAQTALIDPATKELIFLNRALRRDLGLRDGIEPEGRKCYEVLFGNPHPCENCLLQEMPEGESLELSCCFGTEGRVYRTEYIPAQYLGRKLNLLVATPSNIEDKSYGSLILDSETWANEAITTGLEEKDPSVGIQKCIAHIAKNLKSERFFIFEERGNGTVSCTFEWARKELLPWKEELQGIPKQELSALYEIFRTDKVAIVEDYAAFAAQHPEFMLPIPDIKNIISGELAISGEPLGFTLVLNSPDCRPAGQMLSTLTDFIAVMLRNRNNLQDAYEASLRDPMTGVCNRRGLERYFSRRTGTGSTAFVSGDINGLKQENDTMGHGAGDQLILRIAEILIHAADRDHVFRMGGDEFLLIREDMDEAGARKLVRQIRYACTAGGVSMALGYVVKTGRIASLDSVLREADLAMYEDKGRFHRRRRTDPKD